MKRNLFLTAVLITLFFNVFNAQTTFDFESLTVPVNGYWNGSDGSGLYGNSEVEFPNNYNSTYSSWSGFSFAYDTIVSDKQYAANANSVSGHIFGIGYVPSDWQSGTYDNIPIVCKFANPVNIQSVEFTNNARTAEVILNGSGSDPAFSEDDYFKIIVEGFYNNQSQGSVDYLLADYLGSNSIIIDTWEELDLTSFGVVDSISFNLESTHTGNYGMNTPAYFCLDNLKYSNIISVENELSDNISIYPNPANSTVNIDNVLGANISINDITGKTIYTKNNCLNNEKVDISNLKSGIYFIRIKDNSRIFTKKLIVK